MNPCADLSIPIEPTQDSSPPTLPSRRNTDAYADTDLEGTDDDSLSYEYDNYELSVYANDNNLEGAGVYQDANSDSNVMGDRQWSYEEEPYYDDIFQDEEYIEDHFNSDENSSDISASNVYYQNDNDSMYDEDISSHQTPCKPAITRVINLVDNSNEHHS